MLYRTLDNTVYSRCRWCDIEYLPNIHQFPIPLILILTESWFWLAQVGRTLLSVFLKPSEVDEVSSSRSHVTEECHAMNVVSFWKNASLNSIICLQDSTYPITFGSISAQGMRKLLLQEIFKTRTGKTTLDLDPRRLGKVTCGPYITGQSQTKWVCDRVKFLSITSWQFTNMWYI